MSIAYVTCPDWQYIELAGEHPVISGCRRIDVQPDDPLLDWKNIVVYLEFHRPDRKNPDDTRPKGYTGRFLIRKIAQCMRGYPGILPNAVMLLLDEYEPNDVETLMIKEQVTDLLVRAERVGGTLKARSMLEIAETTAPPA
ncbi:MAG TPA: hypothetical protein PK668_18745 [Myxococcota bacterium]|nr:hypothetical protein [Myxococcota bacterium]HRY96591.1 hypothetical protein [Myxococcota bacterium]HSA20860.1 hypothetical protein [Myxococcota bacterium]